MQSITAGVSCFTGLLVGRVYLIEDPDGLTVIDAGLGSAAQKIVKQLTAIGRRPTEVKRLLITHAHPDHIGGLAELQQITGAEVIAHVLERPMIEGRVSITRRAPGSSPSDTPVKAARVQREVQGGETLPEVLGGLEVLFTPGHAPGHVCFWQPEKRLLFCGDVVLHLRGLRLPIATFTVDMDENKRSVKKLAELDARVVCFGHGQPLTQDTAGRLRAFAAKF